MNMKKILISLAIMVILVVPLFAIRLMANEPPAQPSPETPSTQTPSTTPSVETPPALAETSNASRVVLHPEVDADGNGIEDYTDAIIANATATDRGNEFAHIIVELSKAPTDEDFAILESYGGVNISEGGVTEGSCYGFTVFIPYGKINDFVNADLNVGYVEGHTEPIQLYMNYGAVQSGARGIYGAWATTKGDSNSTIALIDTGIDATQKTFAGGYGDKDFTKKIVGWKEFSSGSNSTTPYDLDEGHGTMTA